MQPCLSCGKEEWLELPPPNNNYSISSDGIVLPEPFGKRECVHCGLIQRCVNSDAEKVRDFYTTQYDLYNHRPEAERFETGRYPALSRTVVEAAAPSLPRRVLEIGCGNGSAIKELRELWPEAEIIGLEPMQSAVREAQEQGLPVYQGVLGHTLPSSIIGRFDVIYSLHVIEHVPNPVEFLKTIRTLLAPKGRIVITCPNALLPNAEILHADHLYSMMPYHLEKFVSRTGLVPYKTGACSGAGGREHEYNQFIAAENMERDKDLSKETMVPPYLEQTARLALSKARRNYLKAWNDIDNTLLRRIGNSPSVYCFGTGGWAGMLAGYAPQVWKRIKACVIDGGSKQQFHGKPIYDYASLANCNAEVMLMAVNPTIQDVLAKRFIGTSIKSITWHDVIPA